MARRQCHTPTYYIFSTVFSAHGTTNKRIKNGGGSDHQVLMFIVFIFIYSYTLIIILIINATKKKHALTFFASLS